MDTQFSEILNQTNNSNNDICDGFYHKKTEAFYIIADAPKAKLPKLKLLSIDPCFIENGRDHSTSRYNIMHQKGSGSKLVIRRGQEFFLNLKFNRDYDFETDEISITFTLEHEKKSKIHRDGTFIVTPLLNLGEKSIKPWQASSDSFSSKSVKIKIKSPSDAIIGKWKLKVESKTNNLTTSVRGKVSEMNFYMILNPWCSADAVFMEHENYRQEYVTADEGLIWMGTRHNLLTKYWKYSQFQKDILDCAFYLLTEVAKVPLIDRNNPIMIARGLSEVINSNDNEGVLVDYSFKNSRGTTSPRAWMGSLEILKKYYEKKAPVKYGQCWVFAGVLTTIFRCLGMPCRVVTSYSSGFGNNLDINYVFDPYSAKRRTDISNDNLWSFHVWNEVWMERSDLGPKYGGWQVVDSTPQISAYGPSSVVAIKHGEIDLPFNGNSIYASINANEYQWIYVGNAKRELNSKERSSAGRMISTKAVGFQGREDLTRNYKYQHDSIEEQESMAKANLHCKTFFDRYFVTKFFDKVAFNLEFRDDIIIGNPFSVVLTMRNRDRKCIHGVTAILRVEAIDYTYKKRETVKISKTFTLVKPLELEKVQSNFSWEEYSSKLTNCSTFKISCTCFVKNVDFEYIVEEEFTLVKPTIKIELGGDAEVDKATKGTASFLNPLPVPLKNGKFQIQRPGSESLMTMKLPKSVKPGELASCIFYMTPQLEGSAAVAVKFISQELDDVEGFLPLMVNRSV